MTTTGTPISHMIIAGIYFAPSLWMFRHTDRVALTFSTG
jgi:hypothetical protein